ncbi:cytochrome c biogenesis CcdA family protein [Devosia sp.]|uniref:cytochrome c biogenesis CcdA family protein n=1 Tax=Devosia sp. TaxID=1871048 RepID=UPI003BAA2CA2
MIALLLAFVAGLLTILNPCVLPLVPIVVAGAAAKDARGPLALAAGLAVTFGIAGGVIASLGAELGDNLALRIVSSIAMIIVGVAIAVPAVAEVGERVLAPMVTLGHRLSNAMPATGLVGQFGLGALLALVWGPCVGPTLGAALVLAAGSGTLALAMLTMAIFALGAATSLLVAGFLLGRVTQKTRLATRQGARLGRMIFGAALVVIGVAALTGVDRIIEAWLVQIMPEWLVLFATQI